MRLEETMPVTGPAVRLDVACRPPFDWEATLAWLAPRAIPGIESVAPDHGGRYWRSVSLDGHVGWLSIDCGHDDGQLRLCAAASLRPVLPALERRIRRQFDLDADPLAIGRHLARDPALAPLVLSRPGLRVQGAFDGFELAWRAVLGQQVSVRAATTLAGRLVALLADARPRNSAFPLTHAPIQPERLAASNDDVIRRIGVPRTRAATLVTLARAVADGDLPELVDGARDREPADFIRRFTRLPGIGSWTAEYVAMRVLRWPDAFPAGDLGLRKAMGGITVAELRNAAERWRPWRAYAAQHLWATLATAV